MSRPISSLKDLARRLEKEPEHRKEYRRQTPYHDLLLDIIRQRKELGITQKELAERAGMHQSQLSRIENAKHDPRLSTIIQIAEALNMRVDMRLVPIAEFDQTDWENLVVIQPPAEPDNIEYSKETEDQAEVNELHGTHYVSLPT